MDLTVFPTSDPSPAYRYRDSLYAGDLMTAAVVHLDFFTWLAAQPSTKDQICDHFRFAERPADVMLTLFTANGFIQQKAGGVFEITTTGREHLTTGSPWHLGPYYASLKDRPVTRDFLKVLATDRPANWGGDDDGLDWHKAMETESFSKAFTAAMDCRGHLLGQAMASRIDLGSKRLLLDLGGGSGIYACAFSAHNPHLKAVVFDQAPVDAIASRCIKERGFSTSVSVQAGNMFLDELPAEADVHLYSNVLHDWGSKEVRELLKRSYEALPVGGLLIIHDAFVNADKTGPLAVAEYSTMLMHSTQGKCYSVQEYSEYLSEVGFKPGPYVDTTANRGFMTATKD